MVDVVHFVVRVVNGARPPTITLPAGSSNLRLIGVNPGSREFLRASVDYDGIPESDTDSFNLVLQRVRSAGSELIEDQEIFPPAVSPGPSEPVHHQRTFGIASGAGPWTRADQAARSARRPVEAAPRSAMRSPIQMATTARLSPTMTSSGLRVASTGMFALQADACLQLVVYPSARPRARRRPEHVARGSEVLP